MAPARNDLLTSLLKDVSRSFYLTLRVLPKSIRRQIGLAYLLARTTDTIADTELIPLEQQLDALQKLRERILGQNASPLNFGECAQHQASLSERMLLERVEESLGLLSTLAAADLKMVRQVLDTITSGQELDLRRFAGAGPDKIIALQTDAELDDYTYRVAGCVGEFWTAMCIEHLFRLPELDVACSGSFNELGVRFGKGLQLVNILRDVPADLRKGRCYFPSDKLAEAGLTAAHLLAPANEGKFRPLYDHYLDQAEAHLAAGWEYTNLIPFAWMSLRLACAWPILIGLRTLERLRTNRVLDPQQRIKIPRSEVRGIIFKSVVCYPVPRVWRKLGMI
jgi:farnesyl-diphosphate farnesyltransferase